MEMASEGFKEIHGSGDGAEAVFAANPSQQPPEPDRLVSFSCSLGDAFGNCLEESLEPLWLDAAQNASPEQEIADGADCLWSICRGYDGLEQLILCTEHSAHD